MIIAATSEILIPIIYVLVLGTLALVILLLVDRIFRRSPSKEKIAAFAKRFEERLLSPKIEELEKHFGHTFPQGIKNLYINREEILKENFEVVDAGNDGNKKFWFIAYYEPADLENVRDAWPNAKEVFEFANDGCGNGYTVDPKLDDPPVMFYDHETGEWKKVAASFSKFMARPRQN